MGWLTPEAQMVQHPNWQADGAQHAATLKPAPDMPVPALNTTTQALRVQPGEAPMPINTTLDTGFDFCPRLAACGFPLMLKRELAPPDGATAPSQPSLADKLFILRLMTAPGGGLSPLWQFNPSDRLPPLIAARADGRPLEPAHWVALREFYDTRAPQAWQLNAIDAVSSPYECRSDEEFQVALEEWCRERGFQPPPDMPSTLAERFPVGARVEVQGLRREELNSLVGSVAQLDAERGRVGIDLGQPLGVLSIHPKNLLILKQR